MRDADGQRRGARGVWQDVTKERDRDAALARADNRERLLTYIVRAIRDVADPADMLRIAAEATSRALAGAGGQIFRFLGGGYVPCSLFRASRFGGDHSGRLPKGRFFSMARSRGGRSSGR